MQQKRAWWCDTCAVVGNDDDMMRQRCAHDSTHKTHTTYSSILDEFAAMIASLGTMAHLFWIICDQSVGSHIDSNPITVFVRLLNPRYKHTKCTRTFVIMSMIIIPICRSDDDDDQLNCNWFRCVVRRADNPIPPNIIHHPTSDVRMMANIVICVYTNQ